MKELPEIEWTWPEGMLATTATSQSDVEVLADIESEGITVYRQENGAVFAAINTGRIKGASNAYIFNRIDLKAAGEQSQPSQTVIGRQGGDSK